MPLAIRGKISAAEIVFYVPVFCIAFFIARKHGFGRQAGWVYIFTFSLVRILGAILLIAAESESHPPIGLSIAAGILQGIGLTPLLFATLGFVTKIAHHGIPSSARLLRLIRLLIVAAMVLAIVGGSMITPGSQPSTVSTGRTLSRVGSILFMVAFLALFGLHVQLWKERHLISTHHRTLLTGISLALPFLLVRLIYSLLSNFASSTQSRWSLISGNPWIYLVMGLIMEYLVVWIYITAGVLIPLDKDNEVRAVGVMPTTSYQHQASQDQPFEMAGKRGSPAYSV